MTVSLLQPILPSFFFNLPAVLVENHPNQFFVGAVKFTFWRSVRFIRFTGLNALRGKYNYTVYGCNLTL